MLLDHKVSGNLNPMHITKYRPQGHEIPLIAEFLQSAHVKSKHGDV